MQERMNELEDIKNKLRSAINKLFEKDKFLLNYDVNERSITHKLAEYLEEEFKEYDVDCEYNRDINDTKRLKNFIDKIDADDTEGITVFPDIIIHKRGTHLNLIAIEVKKDNARFNSSAAQFDKEKLSNFTYQSGNFKYEFGFFILLPTCGHQKPVKITLFRNGKEIEPI